VVRRHLTAQVSGAVSAVRSQKVMAGDRAVSDARRACAGIVGALESHMRFPILLFATIAILCAETPAPRKIAYTRVYPQPGQLGLFVASSDGSDERPLLASSDTDYDPTWAPDGKSIVFTSDRSGSADLFRVNPDGSGLTQLTTDPAYDDQAAFSPDSKQLVFVSTRDGGTANLWTMDLETRRAKALTAGKGGDFRPSWSPDGKWIAFSSVRGNAMPFAHGRWERLQLADIYITRPNGSGLKKINKSGGFCGSPKWTGDSSHVVAYCMKPEQTLANRRASPEPGNDTRLVSIDTTTGISSDLRAGPGVKINPSPLAGNEIGYIRKDTEEAGIYYSSGRPGPHGNIRAASWSPDGTHVVFYKSLKTSRPAWRSAFSRNPHYELFQAGALAAFSPSGKEFVTVSLPGSEKRGASLNVTTVATGISKVVFLDKNRNVLAGAWSPGGDQIVFGVGGFAAFFDGFHSLFLKPVDRIEDGAQVAMVNADGTGFRELTSGLGNNAFPSFAADGKRIVYRTFEKDGYGLRIMNLETKAVTTLSGEYDNFPLWSPRGDLIMFSRLVDGAYEVCTIKPDGTGLKRLTFTHGNDAHMAWSPDGEYIVFTSSRMGFKDEVVYTDAPQPYGEIFVMRYDGTSVEQLTDNQWEDGAPAWQPRPPAVESAALAAGK
jgi:TolB protein